MQSPRVWRVEAGQGLRSWVCVATGLWVMGKGRQSAQTGSGQGLRSDAAPPSPAGAGRAIAHWPLCPRQEDGYGHVSRSRGEDRWARRQHSAVATGPPGVRILLPGLMGQEPVSSGLVAPASSQCPARPAVFPVLAFPASLLVQGRVCGQVGGWRPGASGQVRRGVWVSGTGLSPPSPEGRPGAGGGRLCRCNGEDWASFV